MTSAFGGSTVTLMTADFLKNCHSSCLTCTGYGDANEAHCTACPVNRWFDNGYCRWICFEGCSTCSTSQNCDSCKNETLNNFIEDCNTCDCEVVYKEFKMESVAKNDEIDIYKGEYQFKFIIFKEKIGKL